MLCDEQVMKSPAAHPTASKDGGTTAGWGFVWRGLSALGDQRLLDDDGGVDATRRHPLAVRARADGIVSFADRCAGHSAISPTAWKGSRRH